jgi:predicted enzyme related to lactoylglutathione lyase
MIQGLRTVCYTTPDIIKGRDWYSRILGIQPYFDQPYYVGFNVGGYELGLVPDGEPAAKRGAGVVAFWAVDDAHAEYKRLLDLGAQPHEEVKDVGEGILVASVRDPFGNVFGIIKNPHFKLP